MKKRTAEQALFRNRAAQRIMGDPLIVEAFETIQETYRHNWANTTPQEVEKREKAYMLYKVAADTLAQLQTWANSAKVKDIKDRVGNDGGNSSTSTKDK